MEIIELVIGGLGVLATIVFGYPALSDFIKSRQGKKNETIPQKKVNSIPEILRVGCIPFPPFMNYKKVGNHYEYEGIFYDLFKLIEENFGKKVEFIPIQNEESLALLQNDEIDVIAALFKTVTRSRVMDFSSCIYSVSVGGVKRKNDSRIKVQSDLTKRDIKVAVVEGEVGAEIAKDTFEITKNSRRLVEVETHEVGSIISMVESEMVDIAITDNITCKKYLDDNPHLKNELEHIFVKMPIYLGQIGLMHNIGNESLSDFLDEKIKFLRGLDGIIQKEEKIISDYDGMISAVFPHSY